MGYKPVAIATDCGNKARGYGVALVRQDGNEENLTKTVQVDLNPNDKTPKPRIIFDAGTKKERSEEVSAEFVSAYQLLQSKKSLSPADEKTQCAAVSKGAQPTKFQQMIGLVKYPGLPIVGSVLSVTIDATFLHDLQLQPGLNGTSLAYAAYVIRGGGDFLRTFTYVRGASQLSPKWAGVSDGLYGGAAVVSLAVALSRDEGGDPALKFAVDGFSDILGHRLNRHVGPRGGPLLRMVVGAALLGTGVGTLLRQPSISEQDMYAIAGGSNPYPRLQFPNLSRSFISSGTTQILAAGTDLGLYLFTGRTPGPTVPRVGFLQVPGNGGGLAVAGEF